MALRTQLYRASPDSRPPKPNRRVLRGASPARERTSSRQLLWILLVLVAAVELGFGWWMGNLPLLDARLFYTPGEAADLARSLDPSARDRYRWFNIADIAFIGLYTTALVTWLRLISCRCGLRSWVPWLGVLPGCCDGVESLSVAVLLASAVSEASSAAWFAAIATPLKWAATAVVAVLIGALEIALRQRRARRWTRWLGLNRPRASPPSAVGAELRG